MSFFDSITGFINRRRRTLGFLATGVASVYLVGKYAIRKMSEMAELSAKHSADKENLEKRFNLNLQDCQFTIQALLPTLASQILVEMDVEALSGKLAVAAAKLREAECARIEAEDLSRRLEEEALKVERDRVAALERGETDDDPPEEGINLLAPEVDIPVPASPALNPSASVFVPSFGTAPKPTASPIAETPKVESTFPSTHLRSATEEDITASVNDLAAQIVLPPTPSITSSSTEITPSDNSPSAPVELEEQDTVLSKSWAQVVVDGTGAAAELSQSTAALPELESTTGEIVSEPSRAEIWHDIKILSFTRTITSLYVLTLLALQTHVQLNLLGRSNYVSSVISSIPVTGATSLTSGSDSPTLVVENEEIDETNGEESNYEPEKKSEIDRETERMYLTFSWWLLHEGWKIVGARVQAAVEEVVGPMALKSTISFGDLSGLLGQIRVKIDVNDDGSLYDFSPALFPSTPSTEFLTLSSGGLPPSSYSNGISAPLRQLLNETSDFLDCSDCAIVRKNCLDRLFSKFAEGCEGAFKAVGGGNEVARFEDVTERTTRLAGLLPSVARLSHLILNGMPNEFVEVLEDVRELAEFSAIIYSSFDKENLRA